MFIAEAEIGWPRRGIVPQRGAAAARGRLAIALAQVLGGALAILSGGCSALLDSSKDQCTKDSDCAARGAAFSGRVCNDEGLCVAPGQAGSSGAVVEVSAGHFHSCARVASGNVLCWGKNDEAQIGDGKDPAPRPIVPTPVLVANVSDAIQLASGEADACVVVKDKTVRCWGANDEGQLGDGTTQVRLGAVQVPGISDAVQVAVGDAFACAIRGAGDVVCWGNNQVGQLGDGKSPSIEARSPKPVSVVNLRDAVQIALGEAHACAVRSNGKVFCWGANDAGQLGMAGAAPPLSNVPVPVQGIMNARAVELGEKHSCALLSSNELRCWGSNVFGQLGDLGVSGKISQVPVPVVGVYEPKGVSAGGDHTCAYVENGAVRCWGHNDFGQIGKSPAALPQSAAPIEVAGVSSAVAITVGSEHSCAQLSTGAIACWGHNSLGQLGDGLKEQLSATPVQVAGFMPKP